MAEASLRDVLLLEHDSGDLSDEELILLLEANEGKENLSFDYWKHDLFCIDNFNDDECWADFRFKKDDLERLANALQLPEVIETYNRVKVDRMEALCLLLRRLAFPCRYSDLIPKFGCRPIPVLCVIYNHMIDLIYEKFNKLLVDMNQRWLSPENLKKYADAVHASGAPLDNCWGFIDGTLRGITRPEKNQRLMYSGHKRKDGFKFQAVTTPNGLIAQLFGPIEGSRHDSYVLYQSGLLNQLQTHSFAPDGSVLSIYGDTAYPFSLHLQTGHKNPNSDDEALYDQKMSAARASVEWVFGEVINNFRYTDFTKMQKIGLNSVAKQYVVSSLVNNAKTCLYGSKTSTYFKCDPPTLEEYLSI